MADVQELPETQRTALLLREIDALSYDQIAEAMETTIPSVKSLLVRARVGLAEAAEARRLTCEEVREELGLVAEGLTRLSPPVRRHLRECDRCSAFRKSLKDTNKALALMLPIGPLLMLKKLLLAQPARPRAPAAPPPRASRRPPRAPPPAGRDLRRRQRDRLEGRRHRGGRRDRHRRRRRGRPRHERRPRPRSRRRSSPSGPGCGRESRPRPEARACRSAGARKGRGHREARRAGPRPRRRPRRPPDARPDPRAGARHPNPGAAPRPRPRPTRARRSMSTTSSFRRPRRRRTPVPPPSPSSHRTRSRRSSRSRRSRRRSPRRPRRSRPHRPRPRRPRAPASPPSSRAAASADAVAELGLRLGRQQQHALGAVGAEDRAPRSAPGRSDAAGSSRHRARAGRRSASRG